MIEGLLRTAGSSMCPGGLPSCWGSTAREPLESELPYWRGKSAVSQPGAQQNTLARAGSPIQRNTKLPKAMVASWGWRHRPVEGGSRARCCQKAGAYPTVRPRARLRQRMQGPMALSPTSSLGPLTCIFRLVPLLNSKCPSGCSPTRRSAECHGNVENC